MNKINEWTGNVEYVFFFSFLKNRETLMDKIENLIKKNVCKRVLN